MKRYFNHEINNEMPFDLISVFHRNTFTSVNVTKTKPSVLSLIVLHLKNEFLGVLSRGIDFLENVTKAPRPF